MKGFEFPDISETNKEKQINSQEIDSVDELELPIYKEELSRDSYEPELEEINSNPYDDVSTNFNPYQNISNEETNVEINPDDEEDALDNTGAELPNEQEDLTTIDTDAIEAARKKEEKRAHFQSARLAFIVVMFVVIVTIMVSYARMDKSKEKVIIKPITIHTKDDPPIEELDFSAELNNYYQTREKNNIEKMLVDNSSDPEKMSEINSIVLKQIEKIIDDIIKNSSTEIQYDNKILDLDEYLNSLRSIKFNEAELLSEVDYNNIKERLSHLKETSTSYFDALNYYNAKDYNKAYNTFSAIPEDNSFNKAAVEQMNKITGEILGLLKNDITKMSANLDYMNANEQKNRYYQIKLIIEQYNAAYPYLHLETNPTYNDLLQKYTDLSQ